MTRPVDGTAESWQELRTVTPIRRLFAHVIDQCLWIGAFVWLFTAISQGDMSPDEIAVQVPDEMVVQVVVSSLAFLALLIVYLVFAVKGRTLGKWMLGIMIIKNDGAAAGFGTVVMRDGLGKIISAAFLYLGFLWILLDSRNQGWHDKLMGTTVVYVKEYKALGQ